MLDLWKTITGKPVVWERPRYREDICEYCGRKEVLADALPVTVWMCPKCFKKVYAKEQMKAEGRVQVVVNLYGIRCDICGEAHPIMYRVTFRKLCLKCLWEKIGKHHGKPLKADGFRW
jgi:ribosomal protein S14